MSIIQKILAAARCPFEMKYPNVKQENKNMTRPHTRHRKRKNPIECVLLPLSISKAVDIFLFIYCLFCLLELYFDLQPNRTKIFCNNKNSSNVATEKKANSSNNTNRVSHEFYWWRYNKNLTSKSP